MAIQIPTPVPCATSVAEKAMLQRSPRGVCSGVFPCSTVMGSVTLSMGTGSPVKAASPHAKLADLMIRRSQGTLSPSPKMTISPGTRSAAGIINSFPSLMTRASDESISLRASPAF